MSFNAARHVGELRREDAPNPPCLDHVQFQSRTSTKCPATAAAAAIAGLTRCVRPPAPWRPSKLRFEVEALRSPASNRSAFIARHIEQPGSRHSKPAAVNISSRPSSSACFFTRPEPGTISTCFTFAAFCRPLTTAAAARRSSMRELVQEPIKTLSTWMSVIGVPAARPMYFSARARLDGHVADRHAALDRQRADRVAAEFDGVAGAAGRADLADDGEHDVLGRDAGADRAVDAHQHVLRFLLHQALGGERMLDLGGADAEGQRAECAVGGGVRVATYHRHAWQGRAGLGADDVDDALAQVVHLVFGDAELVAVSVERLDLHARGGGGDAPRAVGSGHIVIRRREIRVAPPDIALGKAQAVEGLRRGHLVHQLAIYIDEATAVVVVMYDVGVPQFVVKGFAHKGSSHSMR